MTLSVWAPICQSVFYFFIYFVHLHVSVNVCICSVCVAKCEKGTKKRGLSSWSKKKRGVHVCILTHLRGSLCDFVYMCASDFLWSQKKRDLYFRTYALFSRKHTFRGLNTCKMNSNSSLLGRDFCLFVHLTKHMHISEICCFAEEHDNLTISGISLWLNSPSQCLQTPASVKVDLIFWPLLLWDPPSQPHG